MPSLSYLKVDGTPFDGGAALGRFGARAVHDRLVKTDTWRRTMQWRGHACIQTMTRLVREQFPQIWSELEGLAFGLELTFDDVFLWHCRGDLSSLSPGGCTTVLLPGKDTRRITHNEDGDPCLAGCCGLVDYHIANGPHIVSFVYPGSLFGHTFAMTSNGLAMTVNNMRERALGAGVPRMVLCRAMLDASDARDAVALLTTHSRAGGFHLALAHRDDPQILSVEFSALMCSVETISVPTVHTNHSLHASMRNFPQVITGSSGFRKVRGDEIIAKCLKERRAVEPLAILSDTNNQSFPIYRTDPNDSDAENTMATCDVFISAAGLMWAVRESPGGPVRFAKGGTPALELATGG